MGFRENKALQQRATPHFLQRALDIASATTGLVAAGKGRMPTSDKWCSPGNDWMKMVEGWKDGRKRGFA